MLDQIETIARGTIIAYKVCALEGRVGND